MKSRKMIFLLGVLISTQPACAADLTGMSLQGSLAYLNSSFLLVQPFNATAIGGLGPEFFGRISFDGNTNIDVTIDFNTVGSESVVTISTMFFGAFGNLGHSGGVLKLEFSNPGMPGFALHGTVTCAAPIVHISNPDCYAPYGMEGYTQSTNGKLSIVMTHMSNGGIIAFSEGPVPDIQAPVPEPSTWAMIIVGFGLVGAAMRRKTQAARYWAMAIEPHDMASTI